MGRRALPDAVKEARGTLRPSRVNDEQPTPDALEVGQAPPPWIRGSVRRRAWAGLVELLTGAKVLTVMDTATLGLLVDTFGRYLEARDVVDGKRCGACGRPNHRPRAGCSDPFPGTPYVTSHTGRSGLMIRAHPAMAVMDRALRVMLDILSRFGMDPASRSRVVATLGAGQGRSDSAQRFFQ